MSIGNTLILLTLSTVVLFLIYCYLKMRATLNFWKRKGVKHLKGKLFVGNMSLAGNISMADQAQKLYKEFPGEKYFGFYDFMIPTLMLKDPDLIKQVCIRDFEHFVDHRDFVDPDNDPYMSRILFATHGQKWRDLRLTLTPAFTGNKMRNMFSLMDDCCRKFVTYFEEQNEDLMELNMRDTCSRFANDVIASTAFGVTCDSLRDKNNDFFTVGKSVTDFSGLRILSFFIYLISPTMSRILGLRVMPEKIAKYFSELIKQTIAMREKNKIDRADMLQLLVQAMKGNLKQDEEMEKDENFLTLTKTASKRKIDIDDIVSQGIMFFLAGFDTVSTFLMYLFYELAINPEIQTKLRQEIMSVEEDITYNKLLSLKYLDMVIMETLRLWPPSVLLNRKVTKPFTLESPGMNPVHLEEGVICWIPSIALHRDAKYFPEPDRFDPERFNDENRPKIHAGVYTPFGLGPRSCLGTRFALLESKLLIYHMLKSFEIVPVKRTLVPIVLDPKDLTMTPKGGMWLGFKKISST